MFGPVIRESLCCGENLSRNGLVNRRVPALGQMLAKFVGSEGGVLDEVRVCPCRSIFGTTSGLPQQSANQVQVERQKHGPVVQKGLALPSLGIARNLAIAERDVAHALDTEAERFAPAGERSLQKKARHGAGAEVSQSRGGR